ncbi:MAG: hypothetical protein LBC92_00015 [Rickettsiales bacterium]|jgi:DNA polymerase-1|nr:hypothetical protein [Rickettsiales bacterium]
MNKLILIDGYGLVFRAFFGSKYLNLTKNDGTPIGAVCGFIKMLGNLKKNLKFSHIAVAFDCGKKTFRHEMYPEYKENRPPCPPELIPQFSIVRDVVKAMNIVSIEKPGYEADDIIATYVNKVKNEDYIIEIISKDKDLMQLVNKNVYLRDIFKDTSDEDNSIIGEKEVKDKFGVGPEQVVDVLSLIGDSSDNVKGVPHIGPKTAANLILEFGSVENLINNADNIKKERFRNLIKEHKENLILAKKLIKLNENVEIDNNIDSLQYRGYNEYTFNEFLEKNGLNVRIKTKENTELLF